MRKTALVLLSLSFCVGGCRLLNFGGGNDTATPSEGATKAEAAPEDIEAWLSTDNRELGAAVTQEKLGGLTMRFPAGVELDPSEYIDYARPDGSFEVVFWPVDPDDFPSMDAEQASVEESGVTRWLMNSTEGQGWTLAWETEDVDLETETIDGMEYGIAVRLTEPEPIQCLGSVKDPREIGLLVATCRSVAAL